MLKQIKKIRALLEYFFLSVLVFVVKSYYSLKLNKAHLFEGIFFLGGDQFDLPPPSYFNIFQVERTLYQYLYQYNFTQLLNNIFNEDWK